jgi:alkylation response protein AidB-like acyl-CoA dehydrogenase
MEDTLQALRQEVAGWLARNLPPRPPFKLPQSFLEVESKEQLDYLREWQKKVYAAGYLGMAWPAEYGGRGLPPEYQDVVNEELARVKAPFMFNTIGLFWAGPTILRLGTEAQKRRYIKGILSGDDIWCQGFSEPDHGSDLGNAQTKARREGDSYIIEGRKIWTTLGHFAKYMILLARTNPEAPNKYAGLSFFLAPMDAPGITVRPIRKITGEYGFNEVIFDAARIPADTLVGEEGQGWQVAMAVLAFERGVERGQAGGMVSFPLTVADVADLARRVHRDDRPAIEDPVIADRLVQFFIEERAFRANMARARQQHLLTPSRPLAPMFMGKLYGSELMKRLADFAVTIQGANAPLYLGEPSAIEGGEWQRSAMNAYGATIGGGTTEVQHNIIGERLLGLPKG